MIPDEAVDAARIAIPEDETLSRHTLLAALEAAAPHMMAAAWDKGYKTGLFDKEYYAANPNPYRANV